MENTTSQQQLALISEMISQAKSSVGKGGSSQILMWGWVIATANFGHYILDQIGYYAPFIVWFIVFPAILASVYMGRKTRSSGTSSHLDRLYGRIWLGVGISILLTLMMMQELNGFHNPVIMATAAIGMFVTGSMLKYRPVMYGAFILWAAAVIEWQLPLEHHYLVSGIAVTIGYLIPGYLLKRSEK
jgi:hypothetical protein